MTAEIKGILEQMNAEVNKKGSGSSSVKFEQKVIEDYVREWKAIAKTVYANKAASDCAYSLTGKIMFEFMNEPKFSSPGFDDLEFGAKYKLRRDWRDRSFFGSIMIEKTNKLAAKNEASEDKSLEKKFKL